MSALLAVVSDAQAWSLLTPKQRTAVKLYARPGSDGKRRSVTAICKGLGISRVAFYRRLRRAGLTLMRLAEMVESGDLE